MREGHQQFTPEHLLKVLLDDPEGLAAGLIDRAGGQLARGAGASRGRARQAAEGAAAAGAGQVYLTPQLARVFDTAEKAAEKAGDSFVTVERLLLALAHREGHARPARSLAAAGVDAAERSTPPSRPCARAAPPTPPRPRTPMTR